MIQGNDMNIQKKTLSVQLAIKTREVQASLFKIIGEVEGFSLLNDQDAVRVDVLVLEIGSDPATEFETIRSLLKENVVENLFLTSSKTTTDILLPALRAGAKEFFPQPIDPVEVKAAFHKILKECQQSTQDGKEQKCLGKIFSVLGSKGGVGTTTFAVNFATSIQECAQDKLVALVDMNRLVGEVPLFLDLETDTNWEEIGKNFSRLDAAYLQSAMARHSSGIYVLPAPSRFDKEAHLPAGFLFQLVKAMRRFFDYIIIDSGMYIDDNSFKIFAESEALYLISILSLPCIINVRRLQESFYSSGAVTNGKLRVIANRYEKKAQVSLAEASKILGSEISMTIPNNYPLAMTAINNGKVVAEISRNSNVAKMYQTLAKSVVEPVVETPGGFFNWFRKT